jgi:hypothetical protein
MNEGQEQAAQLTLRASRPPLQFPLRSRYQLRTTDQPDNYNSQSEA